MYDDTLHKLQERIKELTALHATARLLQDNQLPPKDAIARIVRLIPPAWQYPEITVARISFGKLVSESSGFKQSPWRQSADFTVRGGGQGKIEVFYLEERPLFDEGPFLREERDLIESLAEMLRSFLEHQIADEEVRQAKGSLEEEVRARTRELREANLALERQIAEYREAQERIVAYQKQLRKLASELSLAEARERRAIASDLHDHIGQALAFVKMNVSQLRGNAIFCGFEQNLDGIMTLLDQTIRYTRDLTFEISPPVLYELGLGAALEWLAERMQEKIGFKIKVSRERGEHKLPGDVGVTLFKAAQELLANAVKHSGAGKIELGLRFHGRICELTVADNGRGFDTASAGNLPLKNDRFGLFSIAERLKYLGGEMTIDSAPGKGAKITIRHRLDEERREN